MSGFFIYVPVAVKVTSPDTANGMETVPPIVVIFAWNVTKDPLEISRRLSLFVPPITPAMVIAPVPAVRVIL